MSCEVGSCCHPVHWLSAATPLLGYDGGSSGKLRLLTNVVSQANMHITDQCAQVAQGDHICHNCAGYDALLLDDQEVSTPREAVVPQERVFSSSSITGNSSALGNAVEA